jgi:hypothetical protein
VQHAEVEKKRVQLPTNANLGSAIHGSLQLDCQLGPVRVQWALYAACVEHRLEKVGWPSTNNSAVAMIQKTACFDELVGAFQVESYDPQGDAKELAP